MMLLLDVGNTRLKWAVGTGPGDLHGHGALAHRDRDFAARLAEAWRAFEPPQAVFGANVGGAGPAQVIAEQCRARWGIEPVWLASRAQACGVTNGYRDPAQLGIDRWAGLIAAHALADGAACIADCGSAVTVDALDAGGRHLGGLIVPGLGRMAAAVIERSAVPMPAQPGAVDWVGRSTADALASGAAHAVADLIEATRRRLSERAGSEPARILTGGDAEAVARLLPAGWRVVPDLVLQGIALLARASP